MGLQMCNIKSKFLFFNAFNKNKLLSFLSKNRLMAKNSFSSNFSKVLVGTVLWELKKVISAKVFSQSVIWSQSDKKKKLMKRKEKEKIQQKKLKKKMYR